jgi:hypothetical protein
MPVSGGTTVKRQEYLNQALRPTYFLLQADTVFSGLTYAIAIGFALISLSRCLNQKAGEIY